MTAMCAVNDSLTKGGNGRTNGRPPENENSGVNARRHAEAKADLLPLEVERLGERSHTLTSR
jgi:hypothetical protein